MRRLGVIPGDKTKFKSSYPRLRYVPVMDVKLTEGRDTFAGRGIAGGDGIDATVLYLHIATVRKS
jgi:hypothetical protein